LVFLIIFPSGDNARENEMRQRLKNLWEENMGIRKNIALDSEISWVMKRVY